MSDLIARLAEADEQQKPDLATWLASLNPAELAMVEDAGRRWTSTALEKFIRNERVRVSDVSIEKWKATL